MIVMNDMDKKFLELKVSILESIIDDRQRSEYEKALAEEADRVREEIRLRDELDNLGVSFGIDGQGEDEDI